MLTRNSELRSWGRKEKKGQRENCPCSQPDSPPSSVQAELPQCPFRQRNFPPSNRVALHQLTLGATWRHAQSLHLPAFFHFVFHVQLPRTVSCLSNPRLALLLQLVHGPKLSRSGMHPGFERERESVLNNNHNKKSAALFWG